MFSLKLIADWIFLVFNILDGDLTVVRDRLPLYLDKQCYVFHPAFYDIVKWPGYTVKYLLAKAYLLDTLPLNNEHIYGVKYGLEIDPQVIEEPDADYYAHAFEVGFPARLKVYEPVPVHEMHELPYYAAAEELHVTAALVYGEREQKQIPEQPLKACYNLSRKEL